MSVGGCPPIHVTEAGHVTRRPPAPSCVSSTRRLGACGAQADVALLRRRQSVHMRRMADEETQADALVLGQPQARRPRRDPKRHQGVLRSATKAYSGGICRVAHKYSPTCADVGSIDVALRALFYN